MEQSQRGGARTSRAARAPLLRGTRGTTLQQGIKKPQRVKKSQQAQRPTEAPEGRHSGGLARLGGYVPGGRLQARGARRYCAAVQPFSTEPPLLFLSRPICFPLIYPPTLLCVGACAGKVPRVLPVSAPPFCVGESKNRPRARKGGSRLARGFDTLTRACPRLPRVGRTCPRAGGGPRRGAIAWRVRL
jgi:hypothetical protein